MDEEGRIRFYVGTYTDPAQGGGGRSEGIYAGWLDTTSGALEIEGVAATTDSPTFIALNAGRSRLYALRRPPGGPDVVCAYAVDPGSGRLALINEQPCGGMRPAYLSLDRSGRLLFVANYGSGGVASLPVAEDGRLEPPSQVIQHEGNGPVPDRQDGPHAHAIIPDPGNRFALAADLGTDSIYAYPINLAARRLDSKTAYVMKTTP